MEISGIMSIQKPYLYAIQLKGNTTNEFESFLESWQDLEFINAFFESNKGYFYQSYWLGKDVESFRESLIDQLLDFEDELLNLLEDIERGEVINLDSFFIPLENDEYHRFSYQTSKAKNNETPYCLRIYAIRLNENHYVVTGGAVKITPMMQGELGHPLTQKELQKLKLTAEYLNDHFDGKSNPEPRYYHAK